MALGGVTNSVTSGGGTTGAGSAQLARTILALGVAPGSTKNTLLNLSSSAAIKAAFDPGNGGGVGPLGEYAAKLFQHGASNVYCVPVDPSVPATLSAVTQTGTGSGAIAVSLAPHVAIKVICVTGGALGTATFKFSLDGGTTYGSLFTSTVSSYVIRVPGTFCTLTFAAATYVATKTLTVDIFGTVTNGSLWVGAVTQVSNAVNNYDVSVLIGKAGLYSAGTANLTVSLDHGITYGPTYAMPTTGIIAIPGTGIVLTCTATFVVGDAYAFLAAPPGFSTSDITNALNAVMVLNAAPSVALVHVIGLPATAAGAISLASTLDTSCATARVTYGKMWYSMSECPSSVAGDTVIAGGVAALDSADTDAVIRAARSSDYLYSSVFVGTEYQQSAIYSYKIRVPAGWGLAARYVEGDPSSDPSCKGTGALDFYLVGGALHRDEWSSSTSLYDSQFNVLCTSPGSNGAFLGIESGGYGWRNMNVDANFQDADMVRVLMIFLAAVSQAAQKYLGSRQTTASDGTISKAAAAPITGDLDGVAKRTVGLLAGGQFTQPQASSASATCLLTSQLGNSPHRLDIQYTLQRLGYVSAVANNVFFSGTLAVQ